MEEAKIKVTLHLRPAAAAILSQYAGDRHRGEFVSDLLDAQRARDEAEGARLAALEARKTAAKATRKAAETTWAAALRRKPKKRASKHSGGRK